MSVLFGDGAGSVCLEAVESDEDVGIIASAMHTDGDSHMSISLNLAPHCKSKWIDEGKHWPQMNGKKVFIHAVKRLPEVINEVLQKAKMNIEDIDLFIPHQANQRINDHVMEKMNIPPEKMYNNISIYGNTTSATIPISLDEVLRGKCKIGTIMFMGYGSGEHWGAIIYRHIPKGVLP